MTKQLQTLVGIALTAAALGASGAVGAQQTNNTVQAAAKDLPDSSRAESPDASPRWKAVRKSVWGAKAIDAATEQQLVVMAPKRAGDPGFVPVSIKSSVPPGQAGSIKRITLVIDNNPSPIAAIIDFPDQGAAMPSFETRVRVDEYSYVRAIAETRDGRLMQALFFVKASGGCAAAPGGDVAAQEASMGRMLWKTDGVPTPGQPMTVQWTLSHPNHTGMAMDQYTRQFTPAHYVRSVTFSQGDRTLLTADVDFALSENPSLRFTFVPQGDAPLRAEATDTRDKRFAGTAVLKDMR
jgi:sulfur-oxidizing protein SoxY